MLVVHASDLHLDSPMRGLARIGRDAADPELVKTIRLATRSAWQRLVKHCCDEKVSLLLIAGDIFDGSLENGHSAIFFQSTLQQLSQAGCHVVLLHGNHDAECRLGEVVALPERVNLLDAKQPQSLIIEDLGVVVHGQSYESKSVTKNLLEAYPEPLPGLLNIGMLHTNATGSTEHEAYAPCTVSELKAKGYEYFALGHVHSYQALATDPWVVYSGNLQGRDVRETGPKGAVQFEVEEDGSIAELQFLEMSVCRWEHLTIELKADDRVSDALDKVEAATRELRVPLESMPLVVRLSFIGSTAAHDDLQRDLPNFDAKVRNLIAGQDHRMVVEKLRLKTEPLSGTDDLGLDDLEASEALSNFVGVLRGLSTALQSEDDRWLELEREELKQVKNAVKAQLPKSGDEATSTKEFIAEAERFLLSKLQGGAP